MNLFWRQLTHQARIWVAAKATLWPVTRTFSTCGQFTRKQTKRKWKPPHIGRTQGGGVDGCFRARWLYSLAPKDLIFVSGSFLFVINFVTLAIERWVPLNASVKSHAYCLNFRWIHTCSQHTRWTLNGISWFQPITSVLVHLKSCDLFLSFILFWAI